MNQSLNTKVFSSLAQNKQGFFLLHISTKTQQKILMALSEKEIADMLSFLDPSQATDILQKILDTQKREAVIAYLNKDLQEKVSFLFGFAPNTAGGMMDINYIEVDIDATFDQVKKRVISYEKNTGKIPTILVMKNGILKGELSHHSFILHPRSKTQKIKNSLHVLPTLHHSHGSEKVLETLRHLEHKRIAVLDEKESVLGIIYADDIIRLLQKENSTGLYDFAGVKDEEDVFDSIFSKVKHRYKWLVINLGTAYLAAWVVSLFADTLSKFVLLAAYMPIVAGMGGNAATQTLAVMVRSLALGEIELKNCGRALFNEVGAGFINGVLNGLIVAVVAILWNHSPLLGLVTACAMVFNLVVAGFFGAIIPLIMKKFGKDPATSATIFITTATDVLGFFMFLGLATLLLK